MLRSSLDDDFGGVYRWQYGRVMGRGQRRWVIEVQLSQHDDV